MFSPNTLPVVVDDGTDPLPPALLAAPAPPMRPGRALLTNTLNTLGSAVADAHEQAQSEGRPLERRDVLASAARIIAPPPPRRDYEPIVYDENTGLPVNHQTRARVANPTEYAADRYQAALLEAPRADGNGRLMSALKTGGRRFLQGIAHGGGLGGGLGAAAVGMVEGAVRPSSDERFAQADDLNRDRALVGELNKVQKEKAVVELAKQKPGLERERVSLKQKYDQWRMSSGDRKQDSAESYKNFMMELGDRRALTSEGKLELAREWQGIRQEQFGQTFDQRERFEGGRNDDRDAQREQRQRQFDQTFGLNLDRFEETKRRGLTGDSLKTFGVATKGRVERLRAIHTEIGVWNRRKGENTTRPETANENISALQNEAFELDGQIEAAREAALAGVAAPAAGGGVSAPRVPAPSLARPVRRSMPGGRVPSAPRSAAPARTEAEIRALAAARNLDPDELVRRARASGDLR
jgi:hypothetical protein